MIEIKKLRKGEYIEYKNKPYCVRGMESKVISSHSHSVMKLELECILDGSREKITKAGHEKVEKLDIVKRLGQCISKSGGGAQVMSMDDYEVFEAEVLPGILPEMNPGCELTYIDFSGRKIVLEVRK